MIDECQVSLTGYVATQPKTRAFESGATNVSMRVAWTARRQDRLTGEWMDGNTSYVTVYCWRKLATNVAVSLRTGDPVLVKGRLTVRTYDDKEGIRRNIVDVDASSVGHDLSRGVARYQRVRPDTGMTAAEYDAASAAGQLDQATANGGHMAVGSGAGRPEGSGDGRALRFSGGLEAGAEGGLAAVPDLDEMEGGQDDWARDQDRDDLDEQTSSAADGGAGTGDEAGDEAGADSGRGPGSEPEPAAIAS